MAEGGVGVGGLRTGNGHLFLDYCLAFDLLINAHLYAPLEKCSRRVLQIINVKPANAK